MIKFIKKLHGGHISDVSLVEVEGKKYVLKRALAEDIANEKEFYKQMQKHNCDTLATLDHPDLEENQILIEYIGSGKTLSAKGESVDICFQWGKAVKQMHSIKFEQACKIDSHDKQKIMLWPDFIAHEIEQGIKRKKERQTDLPEKLISDTIVALQPLLKREPKEFILAHADLHPDNAFLKDGRVILFDKGYSVFSGDYLYDLATLGRHFFNGAYLNVDDPKHKDDKSFLQAFIKGYGRDFTDQDKKIFDLYVLLRAFNKYPNPFEGHYMEIMGSIIDKRAE